MMLHALLTRIREQSNVNCIYIGIANVDLQLSKEPVLGKWLIKATVEVQYDIHYMYMHVIRWAILMRTWKHVIYVI